MLLRGAATGLGRRSDRAEAAHPAWLISAKESGSYLDRQRLCVRVRAPLP
jgi:hypothetical protein